MLKSHWSKILVAMILVLLTATLFVACGKEEPTKYTVSFYVDGSLYQVVSVDGTSITLPADPVKEGYTFAGWYVDEAGTNLFDPDELGKANLSVYAKWVEEGEIGPGTEITITFDVDGTVYDTVKIASGAVVTLPADPTKEGFTFAGWYLDKAGTTALPANFTADITVYAKWTAISHEHTYVFVPEVAASCEQEGCKAHYTCGGCDKVFDADKVETTLDALTLPKGHTYGTMISATSSTCLVQGTGAHYECSVCHKIFDAAKAETTLDALKLPLGEHEYGPLVAEQSSSCLQTGTYAHYECGVCHKLFDESKNPVEAEDLVIGLGAHQLEPVAEKSSNCAEQGVAAHQECSVCKALFDMDGNATTLDALQLPLSNEHELGELIKEVPATYIETGVAAHFECGVCHKLFDESKNPVEAEDLVLAKKVANVAFDVHGGEGEQAAITATYGEALVSLEGKLTISNSGYYFKGFEYGGILYYDDDGKPVRDYDIDGDATLIARWEVGTFFVHLDLLGGTLPEGASAQMCLTYGEDFTVPIPTRTGYTFDGWYDNEEYTSWNDAEDKLRGKITGSDGVSINPFDKTNNSWHFYAKWTVRYITVGFDSDGGTDMSLYSTAFAYDSTYDIETNPVAQGYCVRYVATKKGYTFLGWYYGDVQYFDKWVDYGGYGYSLPTHDWDLVPQEGETKVILKAKWEVRKSTIKFDNDGGVGGQVEDLYAYYDQEIPALTCDAAPTKEGYTFTGYWSSSGPLYYNADLTPVGHVWDRDDAGLVSNMVARWNPDKVTVSFDANGGSFAGEAPTKTFTYNAKPADFEKKDLPALDTKTFAGYYTAAEGGDQVYDPEGKVLEGYVSKYLANESVTLYAHWEDAGFFVNFDSNGTGTYYDPSEMSGTMPTQFIKSGETTTLSANAFVRVGYTFAGWTDKATGTDYDDEQSVKDLRSAGNSVTLYARWTARTYKAKFDLNGAAGSKDDISDIAFDSFGVDFGSIPERDNYNFAGWYVGDVCYTTNGANGVPTISTNRAWKFTEDTTFTAHWTGKVYKVVLYSLNYDTLAWTTSGNFTATYGAESMPNIGNMPIARTGYTFNGYWSETEGGVQYYNASLASVHAMDLVPEMHEYSSFYASLYPQWTANTYTVTLSSNNTNSEQTTIDVTFGADMPVLESIPFESTNDLRYVFGGFATSPAMGNEMYYNADGTSAKAWDRASNNVILYAIWDNVEYTVTLDCNGGAFEKPKPTQTVKATQIYYLGVPTRTGYNFLGWWKKGGSQITYNYDEGRSMDGYYFDEDIDAEAHWQAKGPYSLYFDINGGDGYVMESVGIYYDGELPTLGMPLPTKSCWTFDGYWYGDDQFYDKDGNKKHAYNVVGSITLVARYINESHDLRHQEEVDNTCTADGWCECWQCNNCSRYFADALATEEVSLEEVKRPAYGHKFGDLIEAKDATCTATGISEDCYYCATCGKYFRDDGLYTTDEVEDAVIDALGHTYGDLISMQVLTCFVDGVAAHYECSECGAIFDANKVATTLEAITVAAPGQHTYADLYTCHDRYCTYCGHLEAATTAHTWVDGVCSVCGSTALKTAMASQGYYRDGDVFYFGSYPQSLVTDDEIIATLNDAAGTLPTESDKQAWTAYPYYIEDSKDTAYMWYQDITVGGVTYRGVYFTSYRPEDVSNPSSAENSKQDENGYETGTAYWFRYDYVVWKVLSEDNGKVLLSANVLDSQELYHGHDARSIDESTVYANNYKYSDVRDWLNDTFYNTAFSALQKEWIAITTVDNSAAGTNADPNSYVCADTEDKVFLLSYQEANTLLTYVQRRKPTTNYAMAQGVAAYEGYAKWRTRSPYNHEFSQTYIRSDGGSFENYGNNDFTSFGVAPALTFDLCGRGHNYVNGVCSVCGKVDAAKVASKGYVYDEANDLIYFGFYPQSKVTDGDTISALATAVAADDLPTAEKNKDWTLYGYYQGIDPVNIVKMWYKDVTVGGKDYRAVYALDYRPQSTTSYGATNSYMDDNGYETGTVYYFAFEPIAWRILDTDDGVSLLVADIALDAQDYYHGISVRDDVCCSNYKESDIRAWLNDEFYNAAFSKLQQDAILTTTVDNSAASTNPFDIANEADHADHWNEGVNDYACANTNDNVFLLSISELTDPDYGFTGRAGAGKPSRERYASDYARSQGLFMDSGKARYWWTRSPYYSEDFNGRYVYYVNASGQTGAFQARAYYSNYTYGVVPAINLDVCSLGHYYVDGECAFCGASFATKGYVIQDDVVYYGEYPTTLVTTPAVTDMLNFLYARYDISKGINMLPEVRRPKAWTKYDYYQNNSNEAQFAWYIDVEYNGERYRGMYFEHYRPDTTQQYYDWSSNVETNGYLKSDRSNIHVYWFRYEPIKWRVLAVDGTAYTLLCETILDAQSFEVVYSTEQVGEEGSEHYTNSYEYSSIRAWLNGEFVDTAFNLMQQELLVETKVANDKASTVEVANSFAGEETDEWVFLPSAADLINTTYGFADTLDDDESRLKMASDYAKAQGIYVNNEGYSNWWTRSSSPIVGYYAKYVSYNGGISHYYDNRVYGIAPMVVIETGTPM